MTQSLLDFKGCDPVRYLLVYSPKADTSAWWTRKLHPSFVHVEVLRQVEPGLYIGVLPFHDYLRVEVLEGNPSGVQQWVTATRPVRGAMFPIGFKTCTSVAKAMLGIRAPWVLTPRQLHKYIYDRGGIV